MENSKWPALSIFKRRFAAFAYRRVAGRICNRPLEIGSVMDPALACLEMSQCVFVNNRYVPSTPLSPPFFIVWLVAFSGCRCGFSAKAAGGCALVRLHVTARLP